LIVVTFTALIRGVIQAIRRKNRDVPYNVRLLLSEKESYTIYFEKLRIIEGLLLCAIGLYFVSQIYADPVYTFNGKFIWYLIVGFVLLAAGLPLCFVCSNGCAVITDRQVIIYRTRCFFNSTLNSVPREKIQRACRISAGRKGVISAFIAFVSAFLKGDKDKASDMGDAAFLNGYLEVCTETDSYKIRLNKNDASFALNDIAQLCESEKEGKNSVSRKFSLIPSIICIAAAFVLILVFGITLTANARNTVEKQYINAVYLEDTQAFSLAYVEYAHLADKYDYRDSAFRSRLCYVQLEMSQGNFKQAVEQINSLGEFEEKSHLLYLCALSLEQENSASLAADIYTLLGNYEDCEERLKLIEDAYNTAVKAFENGELITAAEGFSLLRDYKETAEYVSLIVKEADKLVPPKGNPENLTGKQILKGCNEALPILEKLAWDSEGAALKALCDEYILVYTFD